MRKKVSRHLFVLSATARMIAISLTDYGLRVALKNAGRVFSDSL